MSPPPMKWRPAPVSTTQRSDGSSPISPIRRAIPAATSGCSALTGGLSMVRIATSPSRSERTSKAKRQSPAGHQRLAGDVAGVRGGQERHAGGDLMRLTETAHRDPGADLLLILRRRGHEHP